MLFFVLNTQFAPKPTYERWQRTQAATMEGAESHME